MTSRHRSGRYGSVVAQTASYGSESPHGCPTKKEKIMSSTQKEELFTLFLQALWGAHQMAECNASE